MIISMKKFLKLKFLLLLATSCTLLSSCGGDDNDEPGNPGTAPSGLVTKYGVATPTGRQWVVLFASAKDGNTELRIPGFPVIRVGMTYNYYCYLYSETNEVEFYDERYDGKWEKETDLSRAWMRMPTKDSTPESPKYVYAYIERHETLTNPEHFRCGGQYEYESPLEWNGTSDPPVGWED